MFKTITMVSVFLSLIGCTGYIRESSFIAQDENVITYQDSDIQAWQARFPDHTLIPLTLTSAKDGVVLRGVFLSHTKSNDVIFYIPGNGMKVSEAGIEALQTLAQLDKSIVMFDTRGVGASGGKATIASLIDDAIQQYEFIQHDLQARSVIVHGYSLGSFIAGQLVANVPADALVLQGSATNVDDWIDAKMPWYSKPFLTIEVDEPFRAADNRQVVSTQYSGPLLVIGAGDDEQVPVELSTMLFDASQSENKQLRIVKNAQHENMLDNPQEIAFYKAFLASLPSSLER